MIGLHDALIGLAILAIALAALRAIVSGLWNLLLLVQLRSRRRIALVSFALADLVVFLTAPHVLGPGRMRAVAFLVLALAPTASWQITSWWAWLRDGMATRDAARAIATERQNRLDEAPPRPDAWMPWTDYIFDVEIARGQSRYEPPPI